MTGACVIDWSAVAAWVQAVFSVVAIGVAIWLPRHDRAERRERDLASRRAALVAIAKRARTTVRRMRERCAEGTLDRDVVGWLREEIAAISDVSDRVDLTTLPDTRLVEAFAEVQEACRTAHRRLRYAVGRVPREVREIPVQQGRFDDPAARIEKAIVALESVRTEGRVPND